MRTQAKVLVSALFALLLSACEKPSDEGARVKVGPEAKENRQSFPTLPLLWQEKGGIQETTEDLMALHVAMQRYLKANGDKIFITASGRLEDPGVDVTVKLPVESRTQSLTQTAGNLIKVNIRHNGAYVVKGKLVTEEGLTKWMSEEFEKTPDLKVLIRCDKDSKHLYLANMLSMCNYVGVAWANIAIKTEQ